MTPRAWQRILAELKRRKVFNVAAVYGATSFVILQVADLVFPRLGLPDWTVTLVVTLGLLGFPFAIVLAWAYETGPDGLRRTEPARAGELEAIVALPRARRWPVGIAAFLGIVLLSVGGALGLGMIGERGESYDSIAVLPFVNMSGDPAQEYFGDGLAEELLNALANIEGLKVAARTSTFALKGTTLDARTIADTLHVTTVLEGSVRRSADRVRITAQLIDARTGYHLWSDTYDRPLMDLFAVQSDIAREIVEALSLHLDVDPGTLHRGGTDDVEAYNLYLLGRQKWATRQLPDLREAVRYFEAALARDSSFALAWSGLADGMDALAWRDRDELHRVPDAKLAAQRALALDPELAEAWASVGVLWLDFDRDWRFADLALRRAIQLKPSYASAPRWLADLLRWSGRPEEALEFGRRAIELDPLSPFTRDGYAQTLIVLGRWDEARTVYDSFDGSWDAGLNDVSSARELGYTSQQAAAKAVAWAERIGYSRPEEVDVVALAIYDRALADSAVRVMRRIESEIPTVTRELAEMYVVMGLHDAALDALERAVALGDPRIVVIGTDPMYDPLRHSPRFRRIVESLGLPNGYPPR